MVWICQKSRSPLNSEIELCPCLAKGNNCGPCKGGYHIFCNRVMHGDTEEAYQWFIDNPEATKQITPRGPCPEYDRAVEEINKKENADRK